MIIYIRIKIDRVETYSHFPVRVQGHEEFYWREGKLIVAAGDRIYFGISNEYTIHSVYLEGNKRELFFL